MSFSGRWTWDGVPCPRQHFCSSLTELEVTRLGLGDTRRRAVRSRSASQSRASTPISQNLFASAFLITPHAAESVLNQKWDPHTQANQMRSNEKTHASLLILPHCNTPRRFWIYSLTAREILVYSSSDWAVWTECDEIKFWILQNNTKKQKMNRQHVFLLCCHAKNKQHDQCSSVRQRMSIVLMNHQKRFKLSIWIGLMHGGQTHLRLRAGWEKI